MHSHIRLASIQDREDIRSLHLAAFPEHERDMVAALAAGLLAERSTPETFSLVAEQDGAIVGHAAFSPVIDEDQPALRGYILAPLAVAPACQQCGIGGSLIAAGIERLASRDVDLLFVYGDPAYYSRFGFKADLAAAYEAPYPLRYPFGWQARTLTQARAIPASGNMICVAPLSDPQLW